MFGGATECRHEIAPSGLSERESAFYRTHGSFPPAVGMEESDDSIRSRIDRSRVLAERSTDGTEATRLTAEVGYLLDELNRRQG